MFPSTQDSIISSSSQSIGTKSFLYDFLKGDFFLSDGKLIQCDGKEAIKVWIEKILRTEKGRFSIYDGTEYGACLEDLVVGNSYSAAFIEAELKREIEEALLKHPQILAVSNIKISRGTNTLTAELEVITDDAGANSISVTV